jgi:hypothetical protein
LPQSDVHEKARQVLSHPAGCERRAGITVGPSPYATFRRSVADRFACRKPIRAGLLREHCARQGVSMRPIPVLMICGALILAWTPALAQERAYFVTYDHYLEEPGNLEIAVASTTGFPKTAGPSYTAPWVELEYGFTGWWTAELYLEGVTTRRNGSGFTGWRWESRFRPSKGEHRINPVLYIEYESINEATRIQKEIVGSGALSSEPTADLREEHAHELEAKLILSSAVRGWNISENFIMEKNLSAQEGIEFGYAVGVSRSLGGLARAATCRFCPENVIAGVEAYGGLGSTQEAAWSETRHFIAPVLAWHVGDRSTLKVSTGFGLTPASDRLLLRVGYAYEFPLGGR